MPEPRPARPQLQGLRTRTSLPGNHGTTARDKFHIKTLACHETLTFISLLGLIRTAQRNEATGNLL